MTSLAVVSLPEFVIGSLLILLSLLLARLALADLADRARREPALTTRSELVLPVLTLLGASLASSIRMVRAGMVEALGARLRPDGAAERLPRATVV